MTLYKFLADKVTDVKILTETISLYVESLLWSLCSIVSAGVTFIFSYNDTVDHFTRYILLLSAKVLNR